MIFTQCLGLVSVKSGVSLGFRSLQYRTLFPALLVKKALLGKKLCKNYDLRMPRSYFYLQGNHRYSQF